VIWVRHLRLSRSGVLSPNRCTGIIVRRMVGAKSPLHSKWPERGILSVTACLHQLLFRQYSSWLVFGFSPFQSEYMIEYLVLLLSTDWFFPHWNRIGIELPQSKKTCIQQGCREIINEITVTSFYDYLRQGAESKFLALSLRCDAEREMSATRKEWAELSHRELTAVVSCASFNRDIPSADGSGVVPHLEFPIRAEVVKTWERYALDPSVFHDVCLSSQTEWDIRIRKLLVSPKTLVNQLWRILLGHRLRAFWADLRQRLTAQQLQELTSWYRAMIKIASRDNAATDLPSYIV
jgi:hypothetical protein